MQIITNYRINKPAFSATPSQLAQVRFERLNGHTGRTYCLDKDHVLSWIIDTVFDVANALKPGQVYSLKEGVPLPDERNSIFRKFKKMLDRPYGHNPNYTIRNGLNKIIHEHNEEMEKLSSLQKKGSGLDKINPDFIESSKKGEPTSLKELLDKLESGNKLLSADSLFPNLLAGRDFKASDKRIFRINH